jgi:hypothetical protein
MSLGYEPASVHHRLAGPPDFIQKPGVIELQSRKIGETKSGSYANSFPTSSLTLVASSAGRSHTQTLVIHILGLNQNCYSCTLILEIKIVMCSKFA